MNSYHDVIVYVGSEEYKPSTNYALLLTCTKVAGWQLWKRWEGKEELIGGEYDGTPFCIEVAGLVICGVKPEQTEKPLPFGWDGEVNKG
jgi:hypothetical protein